MLNKLREINNRLINIYQNDPQELQNQNLIKEILKNDHCFFEIDISTAYQILNDLKIKEKDLKTVYLELIDSKNY